MPRRPATPSSPRVTSADGRLEPAHEDVLRAAFREATLRARVHQRLLAVLLHDGAGRSRYDVLIGWAATGGIRGGREGFQDAPCAWRQTVHQGKRPHLVPGRAIISSCFTAPALGLLMRAPAAEPLLRQARRPRAGTSSGLPSRLAALVPLVPMDALAVQRMRPIIVGSVETLELE
jgi:hypothetical protein